MNRRQLFSKCFAIAAGYGGATAAAQIVPQAPMTPAEVAKREREIGLKYCRDKVYFPERIVIPYTMNDKTLVVVELDSQSFMSVGSVKQFRDQAEDIHHGKSQGFAFGKQKCQS